MKERKERKKRERDLSLSEKRTDAIAEGYVEVDVPTGKERLD